jgi:hypothetical protein
VREIKTSDLPVPQNGEAWIYQGVAFPRSVYEGIKNRPLQLEVDYSLTLLEGNSYAIQHSVVTRCCRAWGGALRKWMMMEMI